ncbi:MAG: hypothetical protein FJ241_05255 [Nitrospira sp.]|nr:hypothetical protein [Nitrospira sp.]
MSYETLHEACPERDFVMSSVERFFSPLQNDKSEGFMVTLPRLLQWPHPDKKWRYECFSSLL